MIYMHESSLSEHGKHKFRGVTPPSTESPARLREQFGHSVHVYGTSAALAFETDCTKKGVHTVSIDAALSDPATPKRYTWDTDKIRIQITRAELPAVAAVLFGKRRKCEFMHHGEDKNKGFSMENQGGRIFVKVFSAQRKLRAVPIDLNEVFYISSLFMHQLIKSNPWLTPDNIIASLMVLADTAQSVPAGLEIR